MIVGRKRDQGRKRPETSPRRSKAFSYYGNTTYEKKSRDIEKTVDLSNVGKRLRILPTLIAALVIVISLLINLTLSSRPSVDTIKEEASAYRPLDEYADAAEKIIGNKFSNLTKLTINVREIEESLMAQFPELSAAKLSLPVIGRMPKLVVDISSPAILLSNNGKVYVLDGKGLVVSNANALSAESKAGLSVLRDLSEIPLEIGKQAVTSGTVKFIKTVKAQLIEKGLIITELTLPALANELDVRIDGVDYFIKMDISGDARKQTGSYLAVKGSLESKGIKPSEYIDVRAGEKVFYK